MLHPASVIFPPLCGVSLCIVRFRSACCDVARDLGDSLSHAVLPAGRTLCSQVLTEICSVCFSSQCDLTKHNLPGEISLWVHSSKERMPGKQRWWEQEAAGPTVSTVVWMCKCGVCVHCVHLRVQVDIPAHSHTEAVAESLAH